MGSKKPEEEEEVEGGKVEFSRNGISKFKEKKNEDQRQNLKTRKESQRVPKASSESLTQKPQNRRTTNSKRRLQTHVTSSFMT